MLSSFALSSFCRQFSRAATASSSTTATSSRTVATSASSLASVGAVSGSQLLVFSGSRENQSSYVSSTTNSSSRSFSSSSAAAATATAAASSSNHQNEFVAVLKLNMLQDNPGAVKKKRRIGRGIGSSKGKTSGRGHKGQKARSGGSIPLSFEGGQTRFFKLLPKRGFTNQRHKTDMVAVNLGTIQDYIDMGRLVPTATTTATSTPNCWTMKDLLDAGICTSSSVKNGIKLLAKGKERLTTPIHIEISRASEEAIQAVESLGGEVTTVHYNKLALRALLKPHKFTVPNNHKKQKKGKQKGGGYEGETDDDDDDTAPDQQLSLLPKFARPPPKWQPYYTNWDTHRGYLSVQAQMRKLLKRRPDLEGPFVDALKERDQTL